MFRPLFLCSVLALLAGCARSEDARDAQPDNSPLPTLNTADSGEEDELTVGTWQTGMQEDRPVLEFGPIGAPSRFSFGCDDRRNLLLQWPGAAPGGDLPNMLVTVGSETRRLGVASVGSGSPVLRGTLPATDPFVRVLTGATPHIVVRMGDAPPLVMPPSPTIAAYAQQCAAGQIQAGGAARGNAIEGNGTVNVVAGNVAAPDAR
jgi:hypothetical protein